VRKVSRLEPEFVDLIPDRLEPGTLYVSVPYATAQHLCCCGCGTEVVTPLHPVHWTLAYDGETVSLHPSVGNWALPCGSHYVLRRSNVIWAGRLSADEIEARRRHDRDIAAIHFSECEDGAARPSAEERTYRRGRPWGLLRRLCRLILTTPETRHARSADARVADGPDDEFTPSLRLT
jgi:hypothetical protein